MKNEWIVSISVLLLILDQFLKYLSYNSDHIILNKGISFGFLNNFSFTILVVSFLLLFTLFLAYKYQILRIPLIIIFIGGLGNLLDRLIYGGVVDYLNFYFFKNNISDILISIGFLTTILKLYPPSKFQNSSS